MSVKATIESWRTQRHVIPSGDESHFGVDGARCAFRGRRGGRRIPDGLGDAVAWYHRNETSVFPVTLKHQGLEAAADKVRDPLLHRTFGGWIAAKGFQAVGQSVARNALAGQVIRHSRGRALRTNAGREDLDRSGQESLRSVGRRAGSPCGARRRGGRRSGDGPGFSSTAMSS